MTKKRRVGLFLGIIVITAIIIIIFVADRPSRVTPASVDMTEYQDTIDVLTDTIVELRNDLAKQKLALDSFEKERVALKNEVRLIIEEYAKTNDDLSNGSWDFNINFLTNYLSEKDSVQRGHGTDNNKAATD